MLKLTTCPSATGFPLLSLTVAETTVVAVPLPLSAPANESNANVTLLAPPGVDPAPGVSVGVGVATPPPGVNVAPPPGVDPGPGVPVVQPDVLKVHPAVQLSVPPVKPVPSPWQVWPAKSLPSHCSLRVTTTVMSAAAAAESNTWKAWVALAASLSARPFPQPTVTAYARL